MEQEEFQRRTMQSLSEITRTLRRLTNYDYCLRALCLALTEQPGLDLKRLAEDYEDNLQRIQEQVHPDQQDAEVYAAFLKEIQDRVHRQTPSAG